MEQVAAIWEEGTDEQRRFTRSIMVYANSGRAHYIRAYHGCYDPLPYPLFYPGGELDGKISKFYLKKIRLSVFHETKESTPSGEKQIHIYLQHLHESECVKLLCLSQFQHEILFYAVPDADNASNSVSGSVRRSSRQNETILMPDSGVEGQGTYIVIV
jgi:hypothetical protein